MAPKHPKNESFKWIYNEDCIQGCKRHIPDDFVDLIITDPPYGIGRGWAPQTLQP